MNQEIYLDINWRKITPKWEEMVAENPNANKFNSFLKELLPFVKKVRPKISKTQSLFGNLTLICLEGLILNETAIINEGLNPLIKNGILEIHEADRFREWFKKGGYGNPSKNFSLEGVEYELIVDNYPAGYKDLLLKININDREKKGGYPHYCLATGCTAFGEDGNCYAESKCDWVPNQHKKESGNFRKI